MKKIVSMLLLIAMMAALFAGCGGNSADTSKQVNLKWAINWTEQKDADKVQALVNEKLKDLLPNTTIEFVWEPTIDTKWSLWMASKAEYDLAYRGYTTDMLVEYEAGTYTQLDDLVEEYAPHIKAEREEWATAYNSGSINGELYAIPNEQPILHQSSWLAVPPEWLQYFPVDEFQAEAHANTKTTEKMYQLYDQYLENLVAAGEIVPGSCSFDIDNFFNPMAARGYDFVGTKKGGAWLCYDAFDPDAKIVSFFETEEYKRFIKYMAMWYDKGFIAEDYIATGAVTGTVIGEGNTEGCWYGVEDANGVYAEKDLDGNITRYKLFMDTMKQNFAGVNRFGAEMTYTVIPYTSKNPERAIMLLDLLCSPEGEDLLNLIIYGEEGTHYTKEMSDDGDYVAYGKDYIAQANSGCVYGVPHWMVTNVFNCYRTPNILDGQKAWAEDIVKNGTDTHKTVYYNFEADLSNLAYEIQQASLAVKEYNTQLICGALGTAEYEAEYERFLAKLKSAGIDSIKAELQEQADAYLNSK